MFKSEQVQIGRFEKTHSDINTNYRQIFSENKFSYLVSKKKYSFNDWKELPIRVWVREIVTLLLWQTNKAIEQRQ